MLNINNFKAIVFLTLVFSVFALFDYAQAANPDTKKVAVSAIVDENLLVTQQNSGYLVSTNDKKGASATTTKALITTNKNAGELFIDIKDVEDSILFLSNNY